MRIKFVGKDQPAPAHITDGNTLIELPADQSKPFEHPEASRILKVLPELYKPVNGDGTSKQSKPASDQSGSTDETLQS
jgi:hypothetical protein